MAKLTRLTGKVFGQTADATGQDPEIGQFGSAKAGTYVGTGDVATIQSLPAWSNGWIDAVTPTQQFPTLPEMTGVHKVLSYQEAYILQEGVPEWDNETTYYTDSLCKYTFDNKTIIYKSTIDENTGNLPPSLNGWEIYYSPSTVQSNYIPFCVNSGETSSASAVAMQFVQPILSADGTMGGDEFAVEQSSTYSSYSAYKMFDNNASTEAVADQTNAYFTFYNPDPLNVTAITITNESDSRRAIQTCKVSVSNDGTTFTDIYTYTDGSTGSETWTIDLSSNTGYYNYYRVTALTTGGNPYGIIQTDITATYTNSSSGGAAACLKLPEGSSTVITRNFVQPILTANGTLGGSDFAVASSYYRDYPQYHSGEAYYLFDDAQYTNLSFNGGTFPCSVTIYNPNPLNITQLVLRSWTQGTRNDQWKNGYVYGSNDNSTWTELTSYTNNNGSLGYLFTIDLSSNTNYYTYYKITVTSSNNQTMCENIAITATEQVTISSASNVILDGSTVPVVYTNAYSTTNKFTEQQNLDVSTFADGTYNIFASITNATLTGYANTIYRQSAAPLSPSSNDVWLNTSVRPLSAWIYDGAAWQEFTGVPIGSCEVTSGAATSVKTFPYNYTEKFLVSDACLPSSRTETLTLGASGATYTAPANGWFCLKLLAQSSTLSHAELFVGDRNSTKLISQGNDYYANLLAALLPVKKGDIVTADYTGCNTTDATITLGLFFTYAQGAELEA